MRMGAKRLGHCRLGVLDNTLHLARRGAVLFFGPAIARWAPGGCY